MTKDALQGDSDKICVYQWQIVIDEKAQERNISLLFKIIMQGDEDETKGSYPPEPLGDDTASRIWSILLSSVLNLSRRLSATLCILITSGTASSLWIQTEKIEQIQPTFCEQVSSHVCGKHQGAVVVVHYTWKLSRFRII